MVADLVRYPNLLALKVSQSQHLIKWPEGPVADGLLTRPRQAMQGV